MENTIRLKILFKDNCINYDLFKEFILLVSIDFEKIIYKINRSSKCLIYTEEQFTKILKSLVEANDLFSFEAYNKKYHFRITKKKNCFLSISLDSYAFDRNKAELFSLIDDVFNKDFCLAGYICHDEDISWQNVKDIESFKVKNKPFEHLKLIQSPSFRNKMIVDIESNPGHDHVVNGLWFGSCWAMWFGKQYYDYIPEDAIASFKNGYENIQLKNGARRVLLYEDILSFEKSENRKIQQQFKDVTGMDVIAHELMNKPHENIDPTTELSNGNFEHGGTKMIKRYLDADNEISKKSKAVKVVIHECKVIDNRWITVWNEVIDIH